MQIFSGKNFLEMSIIPLSSWQILQYSMGWVSFHDGTNYVTLVLANFNFDSGPALLVWANIALVTVKFLQIGVTLLRQVPWISVLMLTLKPLQIVMQAYKARKLKPLDDGNKKIPRRN